MKDKKNKRMKLAIVRGKYLSKYEMQGYESLVGKYDIAAFGSLSCYHDQFKFPVVKLASPMDLPNFPYKMPLLNRLMIDAQYLWGLENHLAGFDIVHCVETYFHLTQQCLRAKRQGKVKKVVATVFENIPFANEGIWGRKSFKQRAIKELDHLIAISERAKTALILEGCPADKITVINQHIDTRRFKSKLRPVSKKIKLLFVGRLEKYKGVYEILWAAKQLFTDPELRGHQLEFTLVGEGSEHSRLLALEKRLGIVGQVSHKQAAYEKIPAIYNQADIFIAPSRATEHWQEQFSTVLLEAQASGLAIVTTRSGSIVENVGSAALLVQPADVTSLAQAIKKLILEPDLRKSLGRQARQRAVKLFDINLGAEKLDQVYQGLFK